MQRMHTHRYLHRITIKQPSHRKHNRLHRLNHLQRKHRCCCSTLHLQVLFLHRFLNLQQHQLQCKSTCHRPVSRRHKHRWYQCSLDCSYNRSQPQHLQHQHPQHQNNQPVRCCLLSWSTLEARHRKRKTKQRHKHRHTRALGLSKARSIAICLPVPSQRRIVEPANEHGQASFVNTYETRTLMCQIKPLSGTSRVRICMYLVHRQLGGHLRQ
jgi:hypothetical protein